MRKLTNKIVELIVKENLIDVSQIEKLTYGIETGLEIMVGLACISAIMILTNQILFLSVFLAAFSLLRFFTGGFHLNKFILCLILSNGVLYIIAYNVELFKNVSPYIIVFPTLLIICFFSPQTSQKRQLSCTEKKVFTLRRNLVLIIFVSVLYFSKQSMVRYAIQWALIVNAVSLIMGYIKNIISKSGKIALQMK